MIERELDLHGRTWAEAQQEFVHFYNHSLDQATDPNSIQLRVIHGYGSNGEGGVIRKRLRAFLDRHSDRDLPPELGPRILRVRPAYS